DVVAEQEGSPVVENHQHIHAAIVIKVTDRQAPRGELLVEDRPTLVAHVLKSSPVAGSQVAPQQGVFLILDLAVQLGHFVVGVAGDDKQIHIAVVIVVEKLHSPAAHAAHLHPDAVGNRIIVERFVAVIVIKGEHFLVHIGQEKVHPTILIVVGGVRAHPRSHPAVGAIAYTRLKSDLLESPFAAVGKKKTRHHIVGHEQIHQPVVVDIGGHDSPGDPLDARNPRSLADVRKSTISVIVEKPARHGIIHVRDAIVAVDGPAKAAEFIVRLVEIYRPANEQVQAPVIVIIEPYGAGGETDRIDAGLFGHV